MMGYAFRGIDWVGFDRRFGRTLGAIFVAAFAVLFVWLIYRNAIGSH